MCPPKINPGHASDREKHLHKRSHYITMNKLRDLNLITFGVKLNYMIYEKLCLHNDGIHMKL